MGLWVGEFVAGEQASLFSFLVILAPIRLN